MDIGRRGYDAECRFWRNSPDTATIRWYEASNHAEVLGQDTAIGMGDRESPHYVDYPVGEVAIQDREFGNLCQEKGPGTLPVSDPDSLREGGVLDRSRTPQQYQPNGIACSCLPDYRRKWLNGAPFFGVPRAFAFLEVPGLSLQVPCCRGETVTALEVFLDQGPPSMPLTPLQLTLLFGSAPGLSDIAVHAVTATPSKVVYPYAHEDTRFWVGVFPGVDVPEDADLFITPFVTTPFVGAITVAYSDGPATAWEFPYTGPVAESSVWFYVT